MDADLNAGMGSAEFRQRGKQRVDGAFIDAEREFAAFQAFQFGEAFFYFVAQVDEALGVFKEQGAGIGHAYGAGATHKERLAKVIFQFANGQADGGLRAVEALGSAGEAALLGDHQKDLQFP
jgi:hypothetical protein